VNHKYVAPGGATNAILYCAVVVALLFYHRIVVDYFVLGPTVLWYSGMGNWEDDAGTDKAYDLFGLGRFPM